jgi:hypothetical protein
LLQTWRDLRPAEGVIVNWPVRRTLFCLSPHQTKRDLCFFELVIGTCLVLIALAASHPDPYLKQHSDLRPRELKACRHVHVSIEGIFSIIQRSEPFLFIGGHMFCDVQVRTLCYDLSCTIVSGLLRCLDPLWRTTSSVLT